MSRHKCGVDVMLGLLNNYNRWVLLVLTSTFRWELWHLIVMGIVLSLITLGVYLHLESEYRRSYRGLSNNIQQKEQPESPQ